MFGSPSRFVGSSLASEVFKRKSCVTAMPIEANAREVRSQARKVRSREDVRIRFFNRLHEIRPAEL